MAGGKWVEGLAADAPVADAARHALGVRLGPIPGLLDLAVTQAEHDPEHVHRLRVATRRAGAALRVFADCLPDDVRRRARRQLRRVRRAAGAARDWDVFRATMDERFRRSVPAGVEFLAGFVAGEREAAQRALAGARERRGLALDRALAEAQAEVRAPADGDGTLRELGRSVLAARLAEFENAAAGELTAYPDLHHVRILGKRLRYAMELFGDCFPGEFRDRLYPAIEETQEILGRANDSHEAAIRLTSLRDGLRSLDAKRWESVRPAVEALLSYHRRRLPRERRRFLDWRRRWQESGVGKVFAEILDRTTGSESPRTTGH